MMCSGGVGRTRGVRRDLGVGVILGVLLGVTVAVGVVVGVGVGVTGVVVGVTVALGLPVAVGVGVGVGPDGAQYLPPLPKSPEASPPPQIIISLPVHMAE